MDHELGKSLLSLARTSIAEALASKGSRLEPSPEGPRHSRLEESGATFVTLTLDGQLRGCIGSLQAYRSLREDCQWNAVSAALDDSRFPPLTTKELPLVRIEVSLLSVAKPFPCSDEVEACANLRPGVDGVILSWHGHRATFLPQVWDQLPLPRQFLAALKRKAGLPQDFWASDLRLEVYQVEHVEEPE